MSHSRVKSDNSLSGDTGGTVKVFLHIIAASVKLKTPTTRKIHLELLVPGDTKPKCVFKAKGNGQSITWNEEKYISITGPQVDLRVVEPHQFHKDKVLSEHKILVDNILVAFTKKPDEVLVYAIPDSNMTITIKKDSLVEMLKNVTLPQSFSTKVEKCQKVVEVVLGLGGPLFELHPAAQAVQSLLESVTKKLEQQQICYDGLSTLFQRMQALLPHFQKIHDVEDFDSLKVVILKILEHMQVSLETVLNYSQKSVSGQFFHFVLHSDQQTQFSQLSSVLDSLLQEYDKAFQAEIASMLSKDKVLKYLDRLEYVKIIPGEPCLDNTRVSALSELQDWAQKKEAPIFWLCGIAGTGKSTIATTFVRQLMENKQLAAFFTCRRDHKDLKNPLQLLRNICYRLAQVHKPYGRLVAQTIEQDPQFGSGMVSIKSFFTDFFERPIQKLGAVDSFSKPLVVVIDALDECGSPDERTELLECLTTFPGLCTWIKLLVTSRQNPEIKELLAPVACQYIVETESSYQDIQSFVNSRCTRFKLSSNDLERLATASGGLFIWAHTACNYIRQSFSYKEALEQLLQPQGFQSGSSLHILYSTILSEAIGNNSLAIKVYQGVMSTILLVARPVTVTVLAELLPASIAKSAVSEVIDKLHAVLIKDVDETIKVLHPSFAEYLLYETIDCPPIFQIQSSLGHGVLYQSCVGILESKLKFNICHLTSSYILNKDVDGLGEKIAKNISQELQYAAMFWLYHFAVCRETSDVKKSTDAKLELLLTTPSGLYWIEVISLLGEVYNTLQVLFNASFETFSSSTQLQLLLKEYYYFLTMFKEAIVDSTPHIYISGLALSPEQSHFALLRKQKFQNLFSLESGNLKTWIQSVLVIDVGRQVYSISYSPDGEHIVSGCSNGLLRLWDAKTGKALMNLQKHTAVIRSVAYSPCGRLIASASDDHTIIIWNAKTGKPVRGPLQGHTDWVFSVSYSPDGNYIVSGSRDKTLRIWDAQSGNLVMGPSVEHKGQIRCVKYSPDGQYIISGSSQTTIMIWNVQEGRLTLDLLQGHTDAITSLDYSQDGKYIVSGSGDNTIKIWNAKTGEHLVNCIQSHTAAIHSVQFSHDSKFVLSASSDKTIRVWDATTGNAVMNFRGHSNVVFQAIYSPDGCFIASGSLDHTIRIWDITSGTSKLEQPKGHTDMVWQVVYSPDGQCIAFCSGDTTIRVWCAVTGKPAMEPIKAGSQQVRCIAYSPDGQFIASGSDDKMVNIWSSKTGELVKGPLEGHTNKVQCVAWSPSGQCIVSGSADKTIKIWCIDTGGTETLHGHTGAVCCVACSPDGKYIVSSSSDRTLLIWSSETNKPILGPLTGHNGPIWTVVYSPDGKRLLSGSCDKTIRIWDAATGHSIFTSKKVHTGYIATVAYSPDGKSLASGSYDNTIKIWNAETGASSKSCSSWKYLGLMTIVYSPDGNNIVSSSSDGSLRIWN
ncbi:WD40 repeat-like protein, partial [Pluteus cervinus]